MPIEFHCTSCDRLLRTGDDTAGKQAKCPECGAIMLIPASTPPGAFSHGAPPPPPPGSVPAPYPSSAGRPRRPITPSKLDLSVVFSRSWAMFQPNLGTGILACLICWGITFAANMACSFIPFIGSLISMGVQIWIGIGLALYFLKLARGQMVEFDELFKGWPFFLKILLGSLLLGAIFLGATAVCAVPLLLIGLVFSPEAAIVLGIAGAVIGVGVATYFGLVFSQYYYLVIDRDMDVIEAFKLSKELMEGNKLTLFGIQIVASLITIVALIPCGMGLIIAAPFFALMWAAIYLIVTGQPLADDIQRESAEQTAS